MLFRARRPTFASAAAFAVKRIIVRPPQVASMWPNGWRTDRGQSGTYRDLRHLRH